MNTFPKIKGVTWLSDAFPDLISCPLILEDKKKQDLALPGLNIPDIETEQHLDLSKLACIRPFYPVGSDIESKEECMAEFDGIESFVISVPRKNLLQAWLFYKTFIYSR